MLLEIRLLNGSGHAHGYLFILEQAKCPWKSRDAGREAWACSAAAPRASEMEAVTAEDGRQRTASVKDEQGSLLVTAGRFSGSCGGSLGEA